MKPIQKFIHIKGAQQNNLKKINVNIPLKKFSVVCGPSGSGKSSLAFETLFAEGQRRYTETLSNYIRQFIKEASKPLLEEIKNVPPPILLGQRNNIRSSRSIVGSHSEVLDHLRLIFAKTSQVYCPQHQIPLKGYSPPQGAQKIVQELDKGTLLFPVEKIKRSQKKLIKKQLIKDGFIRIGILKKNQMSISSLDASTVLPSSFFIVVDRLMFTQLQRVSDSLSQCYRSCLQYNPHFSSGMALVLDSKNKIHYFNERPSCSICKYEFPFPLTPSLFNFNSTLGACSTCKGFGNTLSIDEKKIVPHPELTLIQGAVHVFTSPSTAFERRTLYAFCKNKKIDLHTAWSKLSQKQKNEIWKGDDKFIGVEGFFDFLEERKYKMHVRIFLSRYKTAFPCKDCESQRTRKEVQHILFQKKNIWQWTQLSFLEIEEELNRIQLSSEQMLLISEALKALKRKVSFINHIGLDYLRLSRPTRTLSGGELQRLNLASQLGLGLSQILYILDEPTIGLHPQDGKRLIQMLQNLQKNGNTILTIEHEPDVIRKAQHIIEMGPGSGEKGGKVIYSGSPSSFFKSTKSPTAMALKKNQTNILKGRVIDSKNFKYFLKLKGCHLHNLKNIDVQIPLNRMVVCSGVSGSGKSSLIVDTLYPALEKALKNKKENSYLKSLEGDQHIKKVSLIDQSPAEKTRRSLVATYMRIYTHIRNIMALTSQSKIQGLTPRAFSLNVDAGRCPDCFGLGYQEIEMVFMDPVRLICETCKGLRFQDHVLDVHFSNKNISQILQLTVDQAMVFFKAHPPIFKPLSILKKVGLEYLKIGQSLSSLSGGESQRLKIARELTGTSIKGTFYILDEPSTGLHMQEVELLLKVLDHLVEKGATVMLVEHNLQVISNCDYIIDLGPHAGEKGGFVVGQSTLNEFLKTNKGATAQCLRAFV